MKIRISLRLVSREGSGYKKQGMMGQGEKRGWGPEEMGAERRWEREEIDCITKSESEKNKSY